MPRQYLVSVIAGLRYAMARHSAEYRVLWLTHGSDGGTQVALATDGRIAILAEWLDPEPVAMSIDRDIVDRYVRSQGWAPLVQMPDAPQRPDVEAILSAPHGAPPWLAVNPQLFGTVGKAINKITGMANRGVNLTFGLDRLLAIRFETATVAVKCVRRDEEIDDSPNVIVSGVIMPMSEVGS